MTSDDSLKALFRDTSEDCQKIMDTFAAPIRREEFRKDFLKLEEELANHPVSKAVAIVDKWISWADCQTYIVELSPGMGYLAMLDRLQELKEAFIQD